MLIIRQHDSNLKEGRKEGRKEEKKTGNGWAPVATDDGGDDQTTREPQQLENLKRVKLLRILVSK